MIMNIILSALLTLSAIAGIVGAASALDATLLRAGRPRPQLMLLRMWLAKLASIDVPGGPCAVCGPPCFSAPGPQCADANL
jgi:hypothetical protein